MWPNLVINWLIQSLIKPMIDVLIVNRPVWPGLLYKQLCDLFSKSCFVKISPSNLHSQTIRASELKFERRFTSPHLLCVRCQMSHVTCHVSHVTCHITHVTCHMLYVSIFIICFFDKVMMPVNEYWFLECRIYWWINELFQQWWKILIQW